VPRAKGPADAPFYVHRGGLAHPPLPRSPKRSSPPTSTSWPRRMPTCGRWGRPCGGPGPVPRRSLAATRTRDEPGTWPTLPPSAVPGRRQAVAVW